MVSRRGSIEPRPEEAGRNPVAKTLVGPLPPVAARFPVPAAAPSLGGLSARISF